MAQNQRRYSSWIMSLIGVHVRSAYANRIYLDRHIIIIILLRIILIHVGHLKGRGIDECFPEVSACGETAINKQRLAGNVIGCRSGQKYRGAMRIL